MLRDRWCGRGSALFSSFSCPYELYERMLIEINNELEKGKQRRIIIRNPPDFDEQEADLLYLNTISELSDDSRLRFNVMPVRNAFKRMTVPYDYKKLSDSPAVAAVAYVLYEIMTIKPWLVDDSEPILLV